MEKKLKVTNGDPFVPTDEVKSVKVGQCYDNITKEFKGSNYVFNFRMLQTEGLLQVTNGQQNKRMIVSSEYQKKSWVQEIGIAAQANVNRVALKASAAYTFNMAEATASNRFNLTAVITNFEIGRTIELINYLTNRDKLLNCLNPTIASDLNDMVQEQNIAKKFHKYLNFIKQYGHGCVLKTYLTGGCFMQMSFDILDSSSASSFQHDAKVGVKSISGTDLNVAGHWAAKQEEECGFKNYDFRETVIPIGNPLSAWVADMKKAIDEDIKYAKEKSPEKAKIPDSPWEPKFIDIKPFTDEEKKAYKQEQVDKLIEDSNDALNRGDIFEAYRTLLMAKKVKGSDAEIDEKLEDCKNVISQKFGEIKNQVGENEELDADSKAFLDNYKALDAKAKSSTDQLLKDQKSIEGIPVMILDGQISEEILLDAFNLITTLQTRFPSSNFLITQKNIAKDCADEKYNEIKTVVALQATITDAERLDAITYLERYKSIAPDKKDEIVQVINDIKSIPRDPGILLKERPAIPREMNNYITAVGDSQDLTTMYLNEQKEQDGCKYLTTEEYKNSLNKAIQDFTVVNIVKEIQNIENHPTVALEIPPTWGKRKPVTSEESGYDQKDYYTYDFEVITWQNLFPKYFEMNFYESFTGIIVGKLMYYHQTRIEFLQYLFFFVSTSYTDIYDNLYSDYKQTMSRCKDLMDLLLNKESAITKEDFNTFVHNVYSTMDGNPDLKKVYDLFFNNYEYFSSAINGYRIQLDFEGIHYLADSRQNIIDKYKDPIPHWAPTKSDSISDNVRVFPKIDIVDQKAVIRLVAFYNDPINKRKGKEKGIQDFFNKLTLGYPEKKSVYEWRLISFSMPQINDSNKRDPSFTQKENAEISYVDETGEIIPGVSIDIKVIYSKVEAGLVQKEDNIRGFPLFIS